MSKIRNVSTFFSQNITETGSLKDSAFTGIIDQDYVGSVDAGGAGITVYDSFAQLPLTGVPEASLAYIDATNKYYVNNGSGWYTISTANNSPQIVGPTVFGGLDSGELTDSDTIFNFTAVDSDGPYIFWNYILDSNANDILSGVVNDSNGTFTLTYDSATTQESGVFTATASDTVNLATKNISIIVPASSVVTNYTELVAAGITSTSSQYTLFKFTNSSYTMQVAGITGIQGYMGVIGGGGGGANRYYGGGGGGGAVIYNSNNVLTIPDGTLSFTIGQGGTGYNVNGNVRVKGDDGGATTVAIGGSTWARAMGGQGGIQGWSGGLTYTGGNYNGGSSSGGGEQINTTAPNLATYAGTTPSGFTLYRNGGGDGASGGGGGGGGAGQAGYPGNSLSGRGGNGLRMSIFSTLEASSGASNGGYFAAGSGGVNYSSAAGDPGLGGAGISQISSGANVRAPTSATNYGSAGGTAMHTAGGTYAAGNGFQGAVFFAIPTALLG